MSVCVCEREKRKTFKVHADSIHHADVSEGGPILQMKCLNKQCSQSTNKQCSQSTNAFKSIRCKSQQCNIPYSISYKWTLKLPNMRGSQIKRSFTEHGDG